MNKDIQNNAEKTILLVTIINALVNAALAFLKIIVGKLGHSQALIADGVHSFSDLVSDALVFVAARASIEHPDQEHPYGHRRIETIITILIGLILLAVGAGIFDEAILRLLHHVIEKPSMDVVIIAVISIVANEALFHYSKNQGEKIHSNLLISNAWHKRSDVFVSIVVLLSVIGSLLGWRWLDPIGAIIIAAMIAKMAVQMIWHSAQELIDHGVDAKTFEKIKDIINSVSGVRSIHQLRTRLHGQSIFVDLHIIVDPFISVSEGHHIGEEVHLKLLKTNKHIHDVTVHIDPENDETSHPSVHLPNREAVKKILADHCSALPGFLNIKKMTLHYLAGHLHVEIDLPSDAASDMSTEALTSHYVTALKEVKEITSLVIHRTPGDGH